MDFDKYNIGFGITGSFCTFAKARKAVEHLCEMGANVIPIFHSMHRPAIPGLAVPKNMWRGSVRSREMKGYVPSVRRSRSDRTISLILW